MCRKLFFCLFAACAIVVLFPASPAAADVVAPNSGLPGSTCEPTAGRLTYTPPDDPGVTVSGLGGGAPAYYEIGRPSAAYLGMKPKGVMIVIHGGAWYTVGKATVAWNRNQANRWREAGWQTVNIDYRGCGQSIGDVLWFMQRVRAIRPNATVCATGVSAGAHLALILAAIRPDLACAIAISGASDLGALENQVAYDPQTGTLTDSGPMKMFNVAVAAFGAKPSPLVFSSPIRYASWMRARVLLASGITDPLVPIEQNADLAAAIRRASPGNYVEVQVLGAGNEPFIHTGVSQASLDEFHSREDALVAPLVK